MKDSITPTKRIEYIDLFRAFGIILMIMGHIGFGGVFDKWIHAFHMPMFFFISGWFYKKTDVPFSVLLAKKAKTLLLPYITIGSIELVIGYLVFSKYSGLQPLISFIFTNTDGQSPVPGALWFLTAMFFMELIYIRLDRVINKQIFLHIIVGSISIFGMVAVDIFPFRLPWGIDAGCVGIGLFHIGHVIKETKAERLLNLKIWITMILGIVVSASSLYSPAVNMRTATYTGYPLFWINALTAIIVGWNLSRYVERVLDHGKLLRGVSGWLKGIGRNSIVYLCLNQMVIIIVTKALHTMGVGGFIVKILVLIFTIMILFGAEKMICNTKLRILVGK